jgi:hypothetical protein
MSSVGTFKSLCLCVILIGCCAAQNVNSASSTSARAARPDIRPAIIQRGAETAQIVAAPGKPGGEVASASFHVASDEEITAMEQTLEQYVIAFESLDLSEVQKVWPNLDKQHSKVFKSAFAAFKSSSANPRLGLECAVPRVAADTANIECVETVTYSVGKGKTKEAGPAKVSIQLKEQSTHWVLQDMKGVG